MTWPGRPAALVLMLSGLAAVITYEVEDWTTWDLAPAAHLSDIQAKPIAALATSTGTLLPPSRLNAWRDQILLRPLFTPGRRAAESAVRIVNGLSRLTGIILTGNRRVALFASPSGGAPITVEEGARVGSYQVRAISDTSVTVVGPEGLTVIRPAYDTAPPPRPTSPKPVPARPAPASSRG